MIKFNMIRGMKGRRPDVLTLDTAAQETHMEKTYETREFHERPITDRSWFWPLIATLVLNFSMFAYSVGVQTQAVTDLKEQVVDLKGDIMRIQQEFDGLITRGMPR